MPDAPIDAFLFDIGNVLVRFDFSKAYRLIAPMSAVQNEAEVLARIEAVKLQYEDGQLARPDFLKRVFEFLQFTGTEDQFIAAWQSIFTANEPMVALVRQLHGRFPMFLLSNTNCMHVEGLLRDFDFFSLFSGATYSHIAQASKPHPRIYEIAAAEHGLSPATTFFIDDLAANIAAAQRLGFQTHHYHPDQHEALTAVLRERAVL